MAAPRCEGDSLKEIRTIFEIMKEIRTSKRKRFAPHKERDSHLRKKEIRISQKSERDSHRFAAFHVEMISVRSFPNRHFRTGSIQVKGTV